MTTLSKFDEVSRLLAPSLKNTELEKPQLIIAFSGIPGAGKSRLSKMLEERYHGVRVGNDSIRAILHHQEFSLSDEEKETFLQDYNEFFIRNYPFTNKLLILDKSMDRQYKRFFPVFDELGLKHFIIRIEIGKEEAIQRILNREEIDPNYLRTNMERWQREFEDFGKNAHYDLLLDGLNPNMNFVYRKIDKLLLQKPLNSFS